MKQSSLSKLRGEIKIAGKYTVDDWIKLRAQLMDKPTNTEKWMEAYDFFKLRVETRFLKPIESILSINKNDGEGYAVCALQCVLIEFLEALYQGKLYQSPDKNNLGKQAELLGITTEQLEKHIQPTKYKSSEKFFASFLTEREPFKDFFNKKQAGIFYRHFRCGLIHEAATKSGSTIRSKKPGDSDCIIEKDGKGIVIFRDAFQEALLKYIENYGNDLIQSELLRTNFIRKMDDVAQIERCFYFAYGSNLATDQIHSRIGYVHSKYKGELKGYAFIYNKKSKDETSKANIKQSDDESTMGICYEIDLYQFDQLKNSHEKDYNEIDVWVKIDEDKYIIAKSFFAKKEFIITDTPPSPEYVEIILRGAKENQLPDDYISKYITALS